jgi:diguanylate cyclase (GGDEF)-like protein
MFDRSAGDAALDRIATAIRKGLRGGDMLFRFGSDELVVLLTQTDATAAQLVTDRVRANIIEAFADRTSEALEITVILGVATGRADGVSLDGLITAARDREYSVAVRRSEPPAVH